MKMYLKEFRDKATKAITVCDEEFYAPRMRAALRLLGGRDPDDCHLLALQLGCPIWSNDRDFEGRRVGACRGSSLRSRRLVYAHGEP